MSEAAIYEFGSRVYCSDADCGELLQVVVEPDVPRLSQLVVCSIADRAARLVAPDWPAPRPTASCWTATKSAFDAVPGHARCGATRTRGPAMLKVVPEAQTKIRRGDHVRALDGDAGRVLGLIVRPVDEAITHVLLAVGHLWHRRHAAVPVDYVAGLGFAGLDVLLTKGQVADFVAPAMRQ